MNAKISFFRSNVLAFGIFQILFFAVMWTSKTVHILYFEKHNALVNFGASYSSMALAGYFSFLIGYFADRWGFRRVMILGGVFYALGLWMRVYPDSLVFSIASGLIAGVGASCLLCALRMWMLELASEGTLARLVGVKSATSSFGTAIGCACAGVLPTLLGDKVNLQNLLAGAAVAMAVWTFLFDIKGPKQTPSPKETALKSPFKDLMKVFTGSKSLFFMTLFLGITTGFYVSFITPYLPLIMKEKGLSLLSIGLSTGSFALLRFFVDPFIAVFVEKNKTASLQIFLAAELLIALITGALLWSFSKESFLLLLVLRSAFLGLSTISEEVLWIQTFPKERIGLLFGLSQSGFFLGDFLGGLINGVVYKSFGLETCIWIVLVVMLVNAAAFLKLFGSYKTKVPC